MTVPIIPGPGAFLEQLGKTGADLINARTQGQLTTQSLAEHAQSLAQHHLQTIMSLAQDGVIPPESLNHPEVQALIQAAGLPSGIQMQPKTGQMVDAQKRKIIAAGESDPRYTAMTGIEGKDTAQAKSDLEAKKLKFDSENLDTEGSIMRGMTAELERNPEFRKLSYAARAGTLSYLTQQLQNQGNIEVAGIHANSQRNSENRALLDSRMQGLRQIWSNATTIFDNEVKAWSQEAFTHSDDEAWLKAHPRPEFADILNQVKQSTGVSDSDIQAAYTGVINASKPGGKQGGAAEEYTGPKLNQTQILNYAQMLQSGQGTLQQLDEAVSSGALWAKDADAIKKAAGIKTGAK